MQIKPNRKMETHPDSKRLQEKQSRTIKAKKMKLITSSKTVT